MRRRDLIGGSLAALLAHEACAQPSWTIPPFGRPIIRPGPAPLGNGPSLDLNFLSGPDPRVTTTRAAGGATYFDSTGTLQLASANTQRIDYDPVTHVCRGLLVEESRTNSVVASQDFSNAAWVANGGTTKTAAFATGLDGTTSAARVLLPATAQSGTSVHQNVNGTGLGASATNTVSAWVRSNTGSNQTFSLKCTQAGVVDHFSSDMTATTTWQRFSYSVAFGSGGTGFYVGVATGSGSAAADLVVWGLQLEIASAFATSYIPTTSVAVTRAADVPVYTTSMFNGAAGTLAVEIGALQNTASGTNTYYGLIDDGTTANRIGFLTPSASANIRTAVSQASVNYVNGGDTTGGTRPTTFKAAVAIGGGNAQSYVNAAVAQPSVSCVYPTGLTELLLGGGGVTQPNAYFRRVRFWPRALSGAELQQVTT